MMNVYTRRRLCSRQYVAVESNREAQEEMGRCSTGELY
jgi:hypothetical protein